MRPYPRAMVRALLLSLMILLVGARVRNPATGHQQLNLVPESQEIQMGQQAAKEVAQSIGLYKSTRTPRSEQEIR